MLCTVLHMLPLVNALPWTLPRQHCICDDEACAAWSVHFLRQSQFAGLARTRPGSGQFAGLSSFRVYLASLMFNRQDMSHGFRQCLVAFLQQLGDCVCVQDEVGMAQGTGWEHALSAVSRDVLPLIDDWLRQHPEVLV